MTGDRDHGVGWCVFVYGPLMLIAELALGVWWMLA